MLNYFKIFCLFLIIFFISFSVVKAADIDLKRYDQLKKIAIVDVEMKPFPTLESGLIESKLTMDIKVQEQILLSIIYNALFNTFIIDTPMAVLSYDDVKGNSEFQKLGSDKGYFDRIMDEDTESLLKGTRGLYDNKNGIKEACKKLNVDGIIILRLTEYSTKKLGSDLSDTVKSEIKYDMTLYLYDNNGKVVLEISEDGGSDALRDQALRLKKDANKMLCDSLMLYKDAYKKLLTSKKDLLSPDVIAKLTSLSASYKANADASLLKQIIKDEFDNMVPADLLTDKVKAKIDPYRDALFGMRMDITTIIKKMLSKVDKKRK